MNSQTEVSTLHAALDTYAEYIGQELRTASSIRNRQSIIKRLKEHHDNNPLDLVNLEVCGEMIDLWRNRPISATTGKPIAVSTVKTTLLELIRFFGWLDDSPQFDWTAPAHFGQVSRGIRKLPTDQLKETKEFSEENLAVLYRLATPMQRLMLCLALNCGMKVAQMGRLNTKNYLFENKDEFTINLLPGEGLLRLDHSKYGVYSEWLLWPETVEAVKWAIARAEELGSELLFVSESGTPMWKESSSHPASEINRLWHRLLRTAENHSVSSLPFSTIRKQMSEWVRKEHGDEMAGMFLNHIQRSEIFYVSTQFQQLHESLRKIRAALAAVFEQPIV